MENNIDSLYEQLFLFFSRSNSKEIVISFIKMGMELFFNNDSIIIESNNKLYKIVVVDNNKKKYWYIYFNNDAFLKRIRCKNGNLDDVFKFLNNYK